jgi:WD40 repeat protein
MRATTCLAVLMLVAGVTGRVIAEGDGPKGMLAELMPEASESHLYSVHFAADAKTIVTVLDKKIHVWDASTYKEARNFTMKQSEARIALSPDGQTYAWNAGDTVLLVNSEDGETAKTVETKPDYGSISNLAYTADGKTIIAVGGTNTNAVIWVIDPAAGTHKLIKGPEVQDNFYALAVSADGKTVACGMNRSAEIHVYDLESGKETKKLTNGEHLSKHLAFSPDGKQLATCGFQEPVRVYNLETGKVAAKFEMNLAVCVAFSPKEGKLLAASDREQFAIFNLETKKPVVICGRKGVAKEIKNDPSSGNGPEDGMCFSADGTKLCWGCELEEWAHVRVWDVATLTGGGEEKK